MAAPAAPNKKRQRTILIGAAAAGLLLLLYLRSRSASSTNATSATDTQGAYMQGAQAQAAQDASLGAGGGGMMPSSFADNGANAAALGDALTQGLQSIGQQFQQFQNTPPSWYTPPAPPSVVDTGATATAPPQSPITINVSPAGNVGSGTAAAPNTQAVSNPFATQDAQYLAPGVSAPNYTLARPKNAPANARWAGPSKPSGNWVGIGGGWWKPGAKK